MVLLPFLISVQYQQAACSDMSREVLCFLECACVCGMEITFIATTLRERRTANVL
jgi:hypothetical protein